MGEAPDYSLATYDDLVLILLHNWNLFEAELRISKSAGRKTFNKINYGLRRYIAHPHKAEMHGYTFEQEDIDDIHAALKIIDV